MGRILLLVTLVALVVATVGAPPAAAASIKADFVFMVDATASMAGEIAGVKAGLAQFVSDLGAAGVDARYALVVYGGAAELVQDFSDAPTTVTNFAKIAIGPVAGFQNNHNVNPEAGLEAIRQVLGADDVGLLRTNVGGLGDLVFRDDARKNLILVTDEDSDRPFHVLNRFPGQTGNEPPGFPNANWQAEVDATADAVIANKAFLNMLINRGDTPSRNQYGDYLADVSDPDFLNFDPVATLANLNVAGLSASLQAQVLNAGLIGRSFNVAGANDSEFVKNFFAAKVEEVVTDVIPEPTSVILLGVGLVGIGALARRRKRAA